MTEQNQLQPHKYTYFASEGILSYPKQTIFLIVGLEKWPGKGTLCITFDVCIKNAEELINLPYIFILIIRSQWSNERQ